MTTSLPPAGSPLAPVLGVALQGLPGVERLTAASVRIAGLALLAGIIGTAVGFVYRWYARDRVPEGPALLLGLGAVAAWLNTQSALQDAILGESDLLDPATAAFTVVAFLVAGVATDVGRRTGDRLGQRTGRVAAVRDLGTMGQIVRSGGRAVTVELPGADDIDDIDGYDPVAPEVKADLAGKTLVFPRGLTVGELRDRLVERLRTDHGVGHVDVELTTAGEVEFVAVGSRAAGIGTTLGPGTAAVAVRADPPNTASPGDAVALYREERGRVATAELRGTAGDVVTLALDEADARALDPGREFRLVTLPADPAVEREFAALLRAADETMGAVAIPENSPLVGLPVGGLDVTVVAVGSTGGVDAIPPRSRTLSAGETVYVVARPEALRRFEAAARPGAAVDEAEESEDGGQAADDD